MLISLGEIRDLNSEPLPFESAISILKVRNITYIPQPHLPLSQTDAPSSLFQIF